jgi:hypothetical protein
MSFTDEVIKASLKLIEQDQIIKELNTINKKYEMAIRWALGEYQDFPIRRTDIDSQYWWRRELRIRAEMEKSKEIPGGSDE